MRGFAPAIRVMSRSDPPAVALDARRAGLVEKDIGEDVRQVARHRNQAIMGIGIDGDGPGAELLDEHVHRAVTLGHRRSERGQKPGRAFEEIGTRASRATRLGTADRVAPNVARIVAGSGADRALGRADVGDRALVGRRVENLAHDRGQCGDGDRDERDVRSAKRPGERRRRLERAPSGCHLERF